MQRLQNIFKRTLAALIFFTRLPFWRICEVDKEYFKRVVPLWPLAGWVTGGAMALVIWSLSYTSLPVGVVIVLAMACRMLVTGALHEDGFADFCDGFGGGTSREQTLSIMKDSHIGTFGVLGLGVYLLLMWNCLTALVCVGISPLVIVAADVMAKWISSHLVLFLPYARTEKEAKNRLVYQRTPVIEQLVGFVLALFPLIVSIVFKVGRSLTLFQWGIALLLPLAALMFMVFYLNRRLGGYTGDCCGATFVMIETIIYLSICVILC